MKIKDIMTRNVEIVHPDDTLQHAAQKMRERDIGFLPVYEGDQLVGVVSDRDLVLRGLAEGMSAKDTLGRDMVTSPVFSCYEDDDVKEAAKIMEKNQIRRMVVRDRNDKKVIGIVSLGDLATNTDKKMSGDVLQSVSEPMNGDVLK